LALIGPLIGSSSGGAGGDGGDGTNGGAGGGSDILGFLGSSSGSSSGGPGGNGASPASGTPVRRRQIGGLFRRPFASAADTNEQDVTYTQLLNDRPRDLRRRLWL
jgi:hypothetical protein